MRKRSVVLTARHEKLVDRLVKSGRYRSGSGVMREGSRLLEQQEAHDAKLKALREAARIGFADLDQGRFADASDDQLEDYVGELGREVGERIGKGRP